MTGTELCHALLLAPLDRKLASCTTADQGPELQDDKTEIAKAHAQCLVQLDRPLSEGRLALDDLKARACIAEVERAGAAWIGPHARMLDLWPYEPCRTMLLPKQAAGDVCTTALECTSELSCLGASAGAIGRCASEAQLPCSPETFSFGVARRTECAPPSTCGDVRGTSGGRNSKPAAVMRLGTGSASGSLPVEVVQRIVRRSIQRFRRCYETALGNAPDLVGEVNTSFTIAAKGAVSRVSTTGSTLADDAAVKCVASHVEVLSFPALDKPTRVIQSFVFGSAADAKRPSSLDGHGPRAVEDDDWRFLGHCGPAPATPPACTAHIDCPVHEYCSTGGSATAPNRCVPRKAAGSPCERPRECKGKCVDDSCVSSCGSG
jgi:hypothetical protein